MWVGGGTEQLIPGPQQQCSRQQQTETRHQQPRSIQVTAARAFQLVATGLYRSVLFSLITSMFSGVQFVYQSTYSGSKISCSVQTNSVLIGVVSKGHSSAGASYSINTSKNSDYITLKVRLTGLSIISQHVRLDVVEKSRKSYKQCLANKDSEQLTANIVNIELFLHYKIQFYIFPFGKVHGIQCSIGNI